MNIDWHFHCRDVTGGGVFYIHCENERKALELFLRKDCAWVGMTIVIFEPEYEFRLAGVVALSSEQPLIGLEGHDMGNVFCPYVEQWALTSAAVKALYVRGADLVLHRVTVIEGCGASMCDGQHNSRERCCALVAGTPNKQILRCLMSSEVAGICKTKFQSTAWTRYMIHEDCMKVRQEMMDW
jgi:hypothetical protein